MVKTCKNRTFKHTLNAKNPRQNDKNQDHARTRTKTNNEVRLDTILTKSKQRQLKDQSNQETKT